MAPAACPSDGNGSPIGLAAYAASFRSKVTETLTGTLGPTPLQETPHSALSLSLAVTRAIPALHEHCSIQRIKIYTSDSHLPAQCLDKFTSFTSIFRAPLESFHWW